MSRPFKNPLFVALDVDSAEEALRIAQELSDVAGGFKVGPRLVYRYGAELLVPLAKLGPVFVDCKFFDIPSVMEASVQAAFDGGATLCTVHALAGKPALERLAALEKKLNEIRPFYVLAVTVLTSFTADTLPDSLLKESVPDHVLRLARLAESSGIKGIVCSGEELPLFQDEPALNSLLKVCPGIRKKTDDSNDQKRIVSPHEAFENGAGVIVVGRPIIAAPNIHQAALDYACAILGDRT